MTGWQVTATTVYCPALRKEVTLLVYKDWRVRCTGHEENGGQSGANGRRGKATAACEGIDCACVTGYRQKLLSEEAVNTGSSGEVQT